MIKNLSVFEFSKARYLLKVTSFYLIDNEKARELLLQQLVLNRSGFAFLYFCVDNYYLQKRVEELIDIKLELYKGKPPTPEVGDAILLVNRKAGQDIEFYLSNIGG